MKQVLKNRVILIVSTLTATFFYSRNSHYYQKNKYLWIIT